MQINRKLSVVLAAMIVVGQIGGSTSPASAATSVEKMMVLQEHLSAGDMDGLMEFVKANPEMLEGSTPLAEGLRKLIAMIEAGQAPVGVSPEMMAFLEQRIRESLGLVDLPAQASAIY